MFDLIWPVNEPPTSSKLGLLPFALLPGGCHIGLDRTSGERCT